MSSLSGHAVGVGVLVVRIGPEPIDFIEVENSVAVAVGRH
jgi:hypothetical protein